MKAPEPASFYTGDAWQSEESIGYLIRQALSALTRAAETQMRLCGLTAVQWAPLMVIARGGESTAAHLARELNTDTGAMTRMLDRLETKGLLTRQRSERDRRVVQLSLTELGKATAERIPHALAQAYNTHLQGFSPAEFDQLKASLRRLAKPQR